MIAKIYMDNRMIDQTNPYKIIKDVMRDNDDWHIIKHTIYVDISSLYSVIMPAKSKSDWSISAKNAGSLFFMYSEDKHENEIMSVVFGQDIDRMCYVMNNPIYITLDREHRTIIVSLTRYPRTDYTVIFDEMDIVEEDTGNSDDSVAEETVEEKE